MTQVGFIRALLPDGSLPAESQAFVSAQVQQEAGQFVTDAQAARAAAEAARDAALAAVPHIIVGAGRPDIPGTLTDPAVADRVAAAPPGTVFRSANAPQGAYEWQKVASTWIVISGRHELTVTPEMLLNGWAYTSSPPKLIRLPYEVHLIIPSSSSGFTGVDATADDFLDLPLGWRVDMSGNYGSIGYLAHGTSGTPEPLSKSRNSLALAARARVNGIISWPTPPTWPTA